MLFLSSHILNTTTIVLLQLRDDRYLHRLLTNCVVTTRQIELFCEMLYTDNTNVIYHILASYKTWCKNSLTMAQLCRNMLESKRLYCYACVVHSVGLVKENYWSHQIMEDEMNGACGTHGREEKCIQGFFFFWRGT